MRFCSSPAGGDKHNSGLPVNTENEEEEEEASACPLAYCVLLII